MKLFLIILSITILPLVSVAENTSKMPQNNDHKVHCIATHQINYFSSLTLNILQLDSLKFITNVNSNELSTPKQEVDTLPTYHTDSTLKSMCFYKNNIPVGSWKSYYKNGNSMAHIEWNDEGLPAAMIINYSNGALALEKKYSYINKEVEITVNSWYKNSARLESYKLYNSQAEYKKHMTELGLEFIMNTKPHFGMYSSIEGKLSGYYNRWFNTGRKWMFLEFDEDLLKEVIHQYSPDNKPIITEFKEGTGTVVHFHHYADTAAVVKYKNGLKHGVYKQYHDGNNTYLSGAYLHGKPDGVWKIKSFSGKLKEVFSFENGHVTSYAEYGPKNKIFREYTFRNGHPDGKAIEYDYYRDTSAVFHFSHGLLHGEFTSYLNGSKTREGFYSYGEQTGDWLTAGLFNDVSHVTSFGDKNTICDEQSIPTENFQIEPNITMPGLLDMEVTPIAYIDITAEVLTKGEFLTKLKQPFDSDDFWGSCTFKVIISPYGLVTDAKLIKSASKAALVEYENLTEHGYVFIPKIVFGFPDNSTMYMEFSLLRID